MAKFSIIRLSHNRANAFIDKHHRHHCRTEYQLFSIGAVLNASGALVGAATAHRPVSRFLDDTLTLEISRLATDGTKDACSFLLSRVAKAAWSLGFYRVSTYIRADEPGVSLRAAGWRHMGTTLAKSWASPTRDREDKTQLYDRFRFQTLHPDARSRDESIYWDIVERMANAAAASGAARTSNPFDGFEGDHRQLWFEFYDTAVDQITA